MHVSPHFSCNDLGIRSQSDKVDCTTGTVKTLKDDTQPPQPQHVSSPAERDENSMTSSIVEAEMEEQYLKDENHKLVLPCVTSQLEDGSPTTEPSPEQPMERESPESPSAIKRWEIGPFFQSFKSKMASFTEMVMSPVRLFKPNDSLSSIDEHEAFMTESNVENSTHPEEVETEDDFRNKPFPKRPSSEKVQCNTALKHRRVVQRLNFCTISTNNHKPVLDHIQMHNEVAPNEENQADCPSSQSQAVLQNGTRDASPCKAQTTVLRTRTNLSTDKSLYFPSAMYVSSQANDQTDAAFVQNRLSGDRESHSSNATCGQKDESCFSEGDSKPESNKTCLNKSDAETSSFSTSSGVELTDKDTSTGGSFERDDMHSQMATRKSPKKKHLSGMTVSTSAELDTFGTVSKYVELKDTQAECSMEWTQHSTELSNPPMSTSVQELRVKRCRETPQTKKDLQASRNCDLDNPKKGRPVRNKKVRNHGNTLEINQVDEKCVPVRKKRKVVSIQQCQQNLDVPIDACKTVDVEMRKPVETSKEMKEGKTLRSQLRKNIKRQTLLTCSDGDATDTTSPQNLTQNVSIDNTMNGLSEATGYLHPTQPQGPERTTEPRKTRRQLKSLHQRNLPPPKPKCEDYSETSVVDPAGPSKPSKRTLLHSEQFITAAEEQETSLSGEARENVKELLSCDSTTVHLETKLSRPTKRVKRPRRKAVSIAKRKGVLVGEDDLESQEKATEVPPVVSSSGSGSNRLLRSYSCPEIPSLVFSDHHLPRFHTHDSSTTSPSRKSPPPPVPILLHSPSKRTRRHTVCSLEIEREIAPLCLRKEVYPASRGAPSCPSSPYSPSASLTALASCFLSSPLAFLSKSSSQGRSHVCDASTGSISAASSFVASSSPPPSFSSPFTSTLTSCHALTSPSSVVTPSPETPSASLSSLCSAFSQSSLEGDHGVLQMECDEAIGEDERSNFDLKLTAAISEEKALSDSEIKTDIKDGQREKRVSSIRIRKKIPKPQNNLTPMGLPKVIRIKKKDFSLEEIYTNKNFSKPPDGRLETIYEVPLNQRDGSQAVVGKKKMKRFVEFPELGVARKPKKPLVGLMAGGGAQRKAGGNSGICRTRRGVGGSSRAEDGLTLQELESLLCSKLEELDMWMALQQVAG